MRTCPLVYYEYVQLLANSGLAAPFGLPEGESVRHNYYVHSCFCFPFSGLPAGRQLAKIALAGSGRSVGLLSRLSTNNDDVFDRRTDGRTASEPRTEKYTHLALQGGASQQPCVYLGYIV